MAFYDRVKESGILHDKYKNLQSGVMLALFGRRRVGKTELIKHFMSDLPQKNKFYFYVDLSSRQEVLLSLSEAVRTQLGENIRFGNFNEFFDFIEQKQHKFVLAIDEFQRFLAVAPEFVTQLQNRWDAELKKHPLMILLVGSSIGMMTKITESKAGALYGRASKIKIAPFRYADFRLMFKNLDEVEKVKRFAVFGGTPYYLEKTKGINDTFQAINELIVKKGGELTEEPKNLMEYENVRVHAKYNSILHSIASGKETLKEMEDFTKISKTTLPAYLHRLDELLDLVGKHDPILGKERAGRYALKDNFFKFWYRFIFPNQTALNLGNEKLVLSIIKTEFDGYVGRIFEVIVRELLIAYLNKKIKNVEISFEDIGAWWDRNGNEIDIVAHHSREKSIIVGEVKWTEELCDRDILDKLIEKSSYLNFSGRYQYILVSKNGFTERCIAEMKERNVLYLDLKDIAKLFDEL